MALERASRCNCDDTVRYDGREKNSWSCGSMDGDDEGWESRTGAIRKASPAPSQSLAVRIGVWA